MSRPDCLIHSLNEQSVAKLTDSASVLKYVNDGISQVHTELDMIPPRGSTGSLQGMARPRVLRRAVQHRAQDGVDMPGAARQSDGSVHGNVSKHRP